MFRKDMFPFSYHKTLEDTVFSHIYYKEIQISIFMSFFIQLMCLAIFIMKVMHVSLQIRSLSKLDINNLINICMRVQMITRLH